DVPDGTGQPELDHQPEPDSSGVGAAGRPPPPGFEPDQPAPRGRYPQRPGPVVAVREWYRAGRDQGRRPAAGSAHAPVGRPWVAGRPVPDRLGGEAEPQLRRGALAQCHQPGGPEPGHQVVVDHRERAPDRAAAQRERYAPGERPAVLDDERHPGQRTVRLVLQRRLEQRPGQRVEVGVGDLQRLPGHRLDLVSAYRTGPDQLPQPELVKLQEWVRVEGARLVVIFEGRDAAGKGSAIKRVTEYLNPRIARIAALPAPTERELSQWYFQRYVPYLPAGGEIVLFDRS